MTSMLRTYAQIPARAKYFLYNDSIDVSGTVPTTSIFTLPEGSYADLTSMATATAVNAVVGIVRGVPPAPTLLKDMGRQITIYDATTHLHLAVYRQVQVVDGIASEGVGGSAPEWGSNYFVKVWSADGQGVAVIRTG